MRGTSRAMRARHARLQQGSARACASVAAVASCVLAIAACGGSPVQRSGAAARASNTTHRETSTQPAQTLVATPARTPRHHHRRKPKPMLLTACDANIKVRAATTTCGFAQNVFYEYWRTSLSDDPSSIQAYSAAGAQAFVLRCTTQASIT